MFTLIKNNIKIIRSLNEWSQETLANKVGVSRQTIISIEKYRYTPSLELAFKLAKVFNLNVTEIFKYTSEEEKI